LLELPVEKIAVMPLRLTKKEKFSTKKRNLDIYKSDKICYNVNILMILEEIHNVE
jgi:hypothetical protein